MELTTHLELHRGAVLPASGQPSNLPQKLRVRRVHEVCGGSAFAFAAMAAGRCEGPVIWIETPGQAGRLCPQGLVPFFDPCRLIVVSVRDRKQGLWCMEEALRTTPAVVITALVKPADLTESRRLQLAAESGGSTGLCLIPDAVQSNAAETRWRSTPLPCGRAGPAHRWNLLKNKRGILGSWDITWSITRRNLTLISSGDQPQVDALWRHE